MDKLTRAMLNEVSLALNPIKFAQSLSIDPDPWQRDLLLSDERRIILNCCRQSGKTLSVAILALHHALNNPGALVLVLSPSLRQSGELFKKILGFYKDLGKPIPSNVETALALQLINRSRIVSLPGKEQTIRGFSGVSLLVIDEAAQVADDLYYSVRPMLAVSDGRIILLSTPRGKRGFFFREWTESEMWKKIKVTAQECPRISAEFLLEELEALGDYWYEQEYCCVFGENETSLFSWDVIQRALLDFDELDLDVNLGGPKGRRAGAFDYKAAGFERDLDKSTRNQTYDKNRR
ncbi:MAG: terminase large subunit domain-containing protein [Halobacteriota archaeon]